MAKKGQKYRRFSEAKWKEIQAKYEAGEPPSNLIRIYGCSESALHKRRRGEVGPGKWINPRSQAAKATKDLEDVKKTIHRAEQELGKPNVQGKAEVQVRTEAALPAPATRAEVVNEDHLELARMLRLRVETLLASKDLGDSGKEQRASRTILELTQALEKLQRIERLALGADEGKALTAPVVVVVPAKEHSDDWQKVASNYREVSDAAE